MRSLSLVRLLWINLVYKWLWLSLLNLHGYWWPHFKILSCLKVWIRLYLFLVFVKFIVTSWLHFLLWLIVILYLIPIIWCVTGQLMRLIQTNFLLRFLVLLLFVELDGICLVLLWRLVIILILSNVRDVWVHCLWVDSWKRGCYVWDLSFWLYVLIFLLVVLLSVILVIIICKLLSFL